MFGGARWIPGRAGGGRDRAAVENLYSGRASREIRWRWWRGDLRGSSKLVQARHPPRPWPSLMPATPSTRDAGLVSPSSAGPRPQPPARRRAADRRPAAAASALIAQGWKNSLSARRLAGAPKPLDMEALDAGDGGGDLSRLVDSVVGGDAATLDREVERLARKAGGSPVTRGAAADDVARPSAPRWTRETAPPPSWRHRPSPCSGRKRRRPASSSASGGPDRIAAPSGGWSRPRRSCDRADRRSAADAELFAICRQAASASALPARDQRHCSTNRPSRTYPVDRIKPESFRTMQGHGPLRPWVGSRLVPVHQMRTRASEFVAAEPLAVV